MLETWQSINDVIIHNQDHPESEKKSNKEWIAMLFIAQGYHIYNYTYEE
jgi:hypothetical protein